MKITVSKQTAKDLDKAIHFFYVSSTKATADNHDGIRELSPERMKILGITTKRLYKLVDVALKINNELKPKKNTNKRANQ